VSTPGGSAFKGALYDALATLWAATDPDVHLTYGPAGTYNPAEVVELLDVVDTEAEGPNGAPRRRNHVLELTGVVTVYLGGGEEVARLAAERAFDLVGDVHTYLQDSGVIATVQGNLGGQVLWARVTRTALTEDDESLADGRTVAVEFTVTALARY
jgi:hypothetical protein